MTDVATWWKTSDMPAESRPLEKRDASRGSFGGQCHHVTCSRIGADWFNKDNSRYYCDTCASSINSDCALLGLPPICALHI